MPSDKEILDDVIRTKVEGIKADRPYANYEPDGDGPITLEQALEGINKIRNCIVGLQTLNWSEHIYPMVALLNRAGYKGLEYPENKENFGTLLDAYVEAIELLKTSPCLKGNSEWQLQAETFLKRVGRGEK
jgi:hypothetical protein